MATVTTAEQLAQSAMEVGVLDHRDVQTVRGDLGTRNVDLHTFSQELLRRNLMTQYQLERVIKGLKSGYFYGKYKVLYCVGKGTFARVFRAVHTESREVFAVKVLRTSCIAEYADAFRREGELGATLKHPNIVPIHEVYSKRDVHYIVMDFIEGRNLREFTRVRRMFEPLEAARILEGMLAGLTYAFQQGVTHRDLKMSNVLVSSEGEAKLLDFGLAGLESEAAGEGVKRTVEYAALERATNVRKDDARSDIFFAGCIFYHMLSGQSPMPEGRDRAKQFSKATFEKIPPISSVAPKVPPTFAKVVNRALEFDPDKRYQTPAEMLADLKIAAKRLAERGETTTTKNELASKEGMDENGESRRLMVVESNVKMQDVLRELFKQHGYRVLVASDPDRAIDRFYTDATAAEIVLFSSGDIGRPAVEGFNRFGQEGGTKDIPAVLLLDERHANWASEANTSDHRTVITMPVKQRELRQAILGAIAQQAVE